MDGKAISSNDYAVYALSMADMFNIIKNSPKIVRQQHGAAAVEFAIIAMLLFTLLFGIIEFGRLFYLYNTAQEITRRAARESVVRWKDNSDSSPAKILALFGSANLPAGAEIKPANINIDYLTEIGGTPNPMPNNATENISACLNGPAGCIALVRVSIIGTANSHCTNDASRACYKPMVGLFSSLEVPIPASTVTMPAESMGYSG